MFKIGTKDRVKEIKKKQASLPRTYKKYVSVRDLQEQGLELMDMFNLEDIIDDPETIQNLKAFNLSWDNIIKMTNAAIQDGPYINNLMSFNEVAKEFGNAMTHAFLESRRINSNSPEH